MITMTRDMGIDNQVTDSENINVNIFYRVKFKLFFLYNHCFWITKIVIPFSKIITKCNNYIIH